MEKKKLDFSSLAKLGGFFALEVIAITAFSLGNSFVFYSIVSLVLAILLALITYKEIKKEGLSNFAIFILPIFIYGLLIALGNFRIDPTFVLDKVTVYFVPFGLSLFALCGYLVSYIKTFKISTALLVIYSALAILSLINLIVTMIQFAPFYTIMYRGLYLYYYGKPSDVTISEMAFSLIGFSLSEVSVEFFSIFPSLLLSAVIPLLFIKYKENKRLFLTYLGFVVLGALSLILTINVSVLVTDLLIGIVLLIVILFSKNKLPTKVIKPGIITLTSLVGLFVVIMFLTSQMNKGGFFNSIQTLFMNNPVLNRLFITNRIVAPYRGILDDIFGNKIFGFPHFGKNVVYDFPEGIYPSGSFIFDNFMFSGVFGWVFFAFILYIGFRQLSSYMKCEEDSKAERYTLLGFVLTFFTYSAFNFDATPYVFKSDTVPFFISGPFLIVLFLLGYCFNKTALKAKVVEVKKEENAHEEVIDL